MESQETIAEKKLSIWAALFPVAFLLILLTYNIQIFGDDGLSGSNQLVMLMSAACACVVGILQKHSFKSMMQKVADNVSSVTTALIILLFVGALAGTWLISGVIPSMIYYGLKVLSPGIFLPATLLICAVISLATGSSWTTSATVGIALVGIGKTIGIPPGMVAGAVVSGAYFGDKMSPMSDTTNLAPAMAGTELFTHIKYMANTTIPTFIISFLLFLIIGLNVDIHGSTDVSEMAGLITSKFNVTPVLFVVPAVVIFMIVRKAEPLVALFTGTMLGAIFALIFQPGIVLSISEMDSFNLNSAFKGVVKAITVDTAIETGNASLNDLFTSGGMAGMLGTIWLIICAMVFGGVMEAIGALSAISRALLKMAKSIFGLFASTVASCLALNITASDQYLAIVVPGKMFEKAYRDRGLAPENLSRTLEDSGTVTSVLIPWNTCGAYQSGVLGVGVSEFAGYAFFNYLSPIMTLIFAAFKIKIKMLTEKK